MPQTYFTFARTLPPSSKISKSVLSLLQHFGWDKLIIIVGRKNEWIQIKDAVKVVHILINSRANIISENVSLSFSYRKWPILEISKLLTLLNWTITFHQKWTKLIR